MRIHSRALSEYIGQVLEFFAPYFALTSDRLFQLWLCFEAWWLLQRLRFLSGIWPFSNFFLNMGRERRPRWIKKALHIGIKRLWFIPRQSTCFTLIWIVLCCQRLTHALSVLSYIKPSQNLSIVGTSYSAIPHIKSQVITSSFCGVIYSDSYFVRGPLVKLKDHIVFIVIEIHSEPNLAQYIGDLCCLMFQRHGWTTLHTVMPLFYLLSFPQLTIKPYHTSEMCVC